VDEVVAADGEGVAVAADHDHMEVRPGDLDSGGEGQRPSVRGVEGVEIHVANRAGGTADAGYERDLVLVQAQPLHGAEDRFEDDPVAAAGAPDVGDVLGAQVMGVIDAFG